MGLPFTKIPADTFEKLQLNAGIILSSFTPATGAFNLADIVGATSGGANFVAQAEYTDLGEDIDNAPKNTKELKELANWTVTLSGTFLTVTAATAKILAAAADVDTTDVTKVVPRTALDEDDFTDIWWVGDYGKDSKFLAIHLMNALSTDGFQLQTTDKGKGTFPFTFTGHFSIDAEDEPPFELYVGKTKSS